MTKCVHTNNNQLFSAVQAFNL